MSERFSWEWIGTGSVEPKDIIDELGPYLKAEPSDYDGVFRWKLYYILERFPQPALQAIEELLEVDDESRADLRGDVLKELGYIRSPETLDKRLDILHRALTSNNHYVYGGAIDGLTNIEDPRSLPYLEELLSREVLPVYKRDVSHLISTIREKRSVQG